MDDLRTGPLNLEPLESRHRVPVLAMLKDGRTWAHIAGSVDEADAKWASMVASAVASREATGVSPWAVLVGERFVGSGGAQALPYGMWNIGFRFVPDTWGHGLAGRVGRAALDAATGARPDWPVTGRTATANAASAKVLGALGMSLRWEGDGATGPAQVWSDRPLKGKQLGWLTEHT